MGIGVGKENMALFIMNGKFRGRGRIFTDASKESNVCGIGIFIEGSKQRFHYRLVTETSITSAELIGIEKATSLIDALQLENFVIYTDSRSACIILQNALEDKRGEDIVIDILTICSKWNTSIQWIPSHVGILGNEVADQLAKAGLSSSNTIDNKLLQKDAHLHFKRQLDLQTAEWYHTCSLEKGKTFYQIQQTFSSTPWYNKIQFNGREVRLINRLMSGHDYSRFWLARMKIVSDADCDWCQVAETAEHVILHCPKYGIRRMNYSFDNKFGSLSDAFKSKDLEIYKEIAEFVRLIKMNL